MLLCFLSCLLVINLSIIRGCTRTISTNLCFFLVYQVNIFPFNFCFVNYSVVYKSKAEALEHTKKRDTGHQSVSLENKTGDSTMLKIGDSDKVIMGSPPASTPLAPPPPPTPTSDASTSTSAVKRTRKASRLRSLSTRLPSVERPVVHVDPVTGKADGPHRKKLTTYLGIVTRDKVDITYENWKEVPSAQKDLIWDDIQAEFDILEASDSRTKRKLLQTVGERWRQFISDLTRKWALAADQDGFEDTDVRIKAQVIQKQNTAPHVLSRGGYDYLEQKLLAEKTKKKLQEAAQSGSVDGVIDPPSLVRRHVKWKMARTKKTWEMTTEAAKEIAEKIISHFQLTITIMFEYFENAMIRLRSRPHRDRSSPMDVRMFWPLLLDVQSTLDVSVLLEPVSPSCNTLDRLHGPANPADQGPARGVHHRESDEAGHGILQPAQLQMQSQGLAVPPEPLVGLGPSGPRVSTKGSCVDPSGNDPETGDFDRCGLYIEADPARLVAMGRVYEGSTLVHNTPLLSGQVKVSVDEAKDADAPVPVPTDEVSLVGQTLHTFLAWSTHLVKSLSQHVAVSPPKPPLKPDPEVRWDATVFGVVNPDFPLYIKHEDLSEIAHGGQCLSISVLQLWILHLTETCMRAGNSDIYGFLEPQSIQRSGQSQFESESYIKSWMQSSQRDVYLGAYLNGPDNYLKGIINSIIKGLDDALQPKSKALVRWIVVKCNRQKGTTECGYYVMHWMSTIILGTFRNNWEAYFNDPRPLELERLKALRIQWAQFYLRVRDQA
ncbi:hypothetical protein HKD37_18G050098 [Glycine soja]